MKPGDTVIWKDDRSVYYIVAGIRPDGYVVLEGFFGLRFKADLFSVIPREELVELLLVGSIQKQ